MADTTNPSGTAPATPTPSIVSLNTTQVAPAAAQPQGLNATLAAQIADKIKANSLNGETDDLTSFETKKKVDDVKQKIYVFGLALVAYFIYTYANGAFTIYNQSGETMSKTNGEIAAVQTKINTFKAHAKALQEITNSSNGSNSINDLITCINNNNLCDKVPLGAKKNLGVTRAYLLLTELTGSKMEIDQKYLLKYFNEYLLVGKDKNTGIETKIGQLQNISFSKPSLVNPAKQIYEVDIDTTISFPGKPEVMQLINKVETGLEPSNPLLIKINSINFNIIKYNEPQTLNVSFAIYYYKK